MKSVKIAFASGCLAIIIVLGMMIYNAHGLNTVDFRGMVLSVAISDSGGVTLYCEAEYGGDFLFKIDDKSKLENCCGEKITVDELSKGSVVQINYRKYILKDEDVHTVKDIKLFN